MIESQATALQVALSYHQAWTGGDFELAMGYIAPGIVCRAPSGRFEGAEAFRAFMGPFAQSLTGSRLLAAIGDDETAVVVYDTATVPVPDAPGAECLTVADGRIQAMTIIFDRLPFEAARRRAASG